MKKPVTLTLLTIALLATATANGLTGEFNQNNTELTPGTQNHIGDLELTSEDTQSLNIQTSLNFHFDTEIQPSELNALDEDQSATIEIYGTPNQAGNFSRPLTVASDEHTLEEEIEVEVPEESSLEASPENITKTQATGDNAPIENVTLEETGNVNHEIRAEVEGNVSQLIDIQTIGYVSNQRETSFNTSYHIPSDAEIQEYNGSIQFKSQEVNETASIPVSIDVEDNTDPEIHGSSFDDVMSTQNQTFSVETTDNNEVANVTAEIFRLDEDSEDAENSTASEDREFVDELFFEPDEDTDLWRTVFNQTDVLGDYEAEVEVEDLAENANTTTGEFSVIELESTEIPEDNIGLSALHAGENHREILFTNSVDTPVEIELSRFSYEGNSTIEIGVLYEDDESPKYFSEESDSVEFDELGEYELAVDSRDDEPVSGTYSFDAELDFTVPENHANTDDNGFLNTVRFQGQINADEYPEPDRITFSDSPFRGYIGYENTVDEFEREFGSIDDDGDTAYLLASIPAETCRGDLDWGECSDVTLGEFDRIDQENSRMSALMFWSVFGSGVVLFGTLFVFALFVRFETTQDSILMEAQ